MAGKLNYKKIKFSKGFTLIEIVVVLILLSFAFLIFLKALNTGKNIRINSEMRTVQSLILNSLESQIRSARYDEQLAPPWSSILGKDIGEITLNQFDDIDDFDNYVDSSLTDHPGFGINVSVFYSHPDSKFRVHQTSQTNFKNVVVTVFHKTLPSIVDTLIISSSI